LQIKIRGKSQRGKSQRGKSQRGKSQRGKSQRGKSQRGKNFNQKPPLNRPRKIKRNERKKNGSYFSLTRRKNLLSSATFSPNFQDETHPYCCDN